MPRLFIANCSKQNQVAYYRLDYSPDGNIDPRAAQRLLPRSIPIPKGRQVSLDLATLEQVKDVITQLTRMGMQGTVDLARLPNKVVPYLFNIDKAVTADQIRHVLQHNDGMLVEDGAERRRLLAVAANEVAQSRSFEMSVEQQEQSEAGERRIEEGFRIDTTAEPPPPVARQRGRPRGRGAARA